MNDKRQISAGATAASAKLGMPMLPPLSGLVELAVLVVAILSIGWIFPDIEISDIQPNPFWLPVLLLSLQYGTVSGILAAGIALLTTVALGLPEEGVGENHFSYALRVYSQPILWFAAAVLLGQFRMRQIAAKQALRESLADLSNQRTALADYATSLRLRLETLERGRAGESDLPTLRLLNSLDAMRRPDVDLATAFQRFVDCTFPGAALSVFSVTSHGLSKIAAAGWGDGASRSEELSQAHPLYQAVIAEGASLSVLDRGSDAALAGEGVIAVPIPSREPGGPVVGLLKVDRIDPEALMPEIVPALHVVAAMLSQRLAPGALRAATVAPAMPVTDLTRSNVRAIRWKPKAAAEAAETGPSEGAAATKPVAVN